MRPYVRRGPALPWWSLLFWEIFCLAALAVVIAGMLIAAYVAGGLLLIGWLISKLWPKPGQIMMCCGMGIFRGMNAIMSVAK